MGDWQETLNEIARLEADNAALRAEVDRLRGHIANIANTINVMGSPWHDAQLALNGVVTHVKRQARTALERKP